MVLRDYVHRLNGLRSVYIVYGAKGWLLHGASCTLVSLPSNISSNNASFESTCMFHRTQPVIIVEEFPLPIEAVWKQPYAPFNTHMSSALSSFSLICVSHHHGTWARQNCYSVTRHSNIFCSVSFTTLCYVLVLKKKNREIYLSNNPCNNKKWKNRF